MDNSQTNFKPIMKSNVTMCFDSSTNSGKRFIDDLSSVNNQQSENQIIKPPQINRQTSNLPSITMPSSSSAIMPSRPAWKSTSNLHGKRPNDDDSDLNKNDDRIFKKSANKFVPAKMINKSITNSSNLNTKNFNGKDSTNANTSADNIKYDLMSMRQNYKIFTGNVDSVVKACKFLSRTEYLYEIFARVKNINIGSYTSEKILLLRNEYGPVIRAAFYEIDNPLPEVKIGDHVQVHCRCLEVGRMQILKLKVIDAGALEEAVRLFAISNFFLKKEKQNYRP